MNWWLERKRRVKSGILGPNLVANFSAESGVTDPNSWFHSLTGTEWGSGDAHHGSRSLRINVNNGTADWRTAVYPVESSQTYRCGVWVKGAADLVTVLAVRWFSNPEGTEYITETWVVSRREPGVVAGAVCGGISGIDG